MVQPYKSKEETVKELRELVENSTLTTATWIMDDEAVKQECHKRICYYIAESQTPAVRNMNYTRKDKRKYKKWLKKKRQERIKAAKEWGPWDACYLYKPLKQTLIDMFEFYRDDLWTWGTPLDGDTRKQTLAQALALLETAEYEEEFGDYELSQQQFRIAFGYIAEHMNEWWD
jgi:hypothetical protein